MPTILFAYTISLINVSIFGVNLCIKILNFAIITIFYEYFCKNIKNICIFIPKNS